MEGRGQDSLAPSTTVLLSRLRGRSHGKENAHETTLDTLLGGYPFHFVTCNYQGNYFIRPTFIVGLLGNELFRPQLSLSSAAITTTTALLGPDY